MRLSRLMRLMKLIEVIEVIKVIWVVRAARVRVIRAIRVIRVDRVIWVNGVNRVHRVTRARAIGGYTATTKEMPPSLHRQSSGGRKRSGVRMITDIIDGEILWGVRMFQCFPCDSPLIGVIRVIGVIRAKEHRMCGKGS